MESTRSSPQKGDIVRVKQGFDRTLEALAVRRAGLPVKESALYEVVGFQHLTPSVVLILREVSAFHIAGVRHIIELGAEPFPYTSDRFQILYKSESSRPVVRIRARSRILRFFGSICSPSRITL
jgi:hypothetical protein